jgi:hypothetical protein
MSSFIVLEGAIQEGMPRTYESVDVILTPMHVHVLAGVATNIKCATIIALSTTPKQRLHFTQITYRIDELLAPNVLSGSEVNSQV